MRWKKDNLQILTSKKNVLRQLLFLEKLFLSRRSKTNCLDVFANSGGGGRSNYLNKNKNKFS